MKTKIVIAALAVFSSLASANSVKCRFLYRMAILQADLDSLKDSASRSKLLESSYQEINIEINERNTKGSQRLGGYKIDWEMDKDGQLQGFLTVTPVDLTNGSATIMVQDANVIPAGKEVISSTLAMGSTPIFFQPRQLHVTCTKQ